MCVCLSVCLSVLRSGLVIQTSLKWQLNANSSKTVKATDFKFDKHVPTNSLDMTPYFFSKRGRGQSKVSPLFFWCKMLIAPKRLKLQTSNLTCSTVRTWPLNFFGKGSVCKNHLAEICTLTSAFYYTCITEQVLCDVIRCRERWRRSRCQWQRVTSVVMTLVIHYVHCNTSISSNISGIACQISCGRKQGFFHLNSYRQNTRQALGIILDSKPGL